MMATSQPTSSYFEPTIGFEPTRTFVSWLQVRCNQPLCDVGIEGQDLVSPFRPCFNWSLVFYLSSWNCCTAKNELPSYGEPLILCYLNQSLFVLHLNNHLRSGEEKRRPVGIPRLELGIKPYESLVMAVSLYPHFTSLHLDKSGRYK